MKQVILFFYVLFSLVNPSVIKKKFTNELTDRQKITNERVTNEAFLLVN